MKSKHEKSLAAQLRAADLSFIREFQILNGRRFRADFLVGENHFGTAEWDLIVEVNGQGPHGHHGGYGHAESDAEKLSAIACLGYRCLVVTGAQVQDGRALRWIRCALGVEGDPETVFSRPKRQRRSQRTTGRHKRNAITKTLDNRALTKLPARVRRAAGLA